MHFQTQQLPVIRATRYLLVHAPDLVRYGSKPSREIERNAAQLDLINSHLRSYEEALAYAPNQVYVGGLYPDDLKSVAVPWFGHALENPARHGEFGEIMPEDEFYGVLRIGDSFDMVWLEENFTAEIRTRLAAHPLLTAEDLKKLGDGKSLGQLNEQIKKGAAIPLYLNKHRLVGCFLHGHDEAPALSATRLLENLACKVIAALSLRNLNVASGIPAQAVDFILGCGEEAIGDRYNPGGGNLAKAAGEMAGCVAASGADIKDFCCAPVQALTMAGGLVASGLHSNIAVVAGCSLAKLGMKYEGHVRKDMPILEDVLAGFASMVGVNDG